MQSVPQRQSQLIGGTSSASASQLHLSGETVPVPAAPHVSPAAPWYDRQAASRRQPSPVLSKTSVSRSPTRVQRALSPAAPTRFVRPPSLSPRSLKVPIVPLSTSSGLAILGQTTAIEACGSISQTMPSTSAPIALVPSTVVLSARSTGTQPNSPPRSVSSITTAVTAAPVSLSTGAELAEQLGQFTASVAALAESIRRSVACSDGDVECCDGLGHGTYSDTNTAIARVTSGSTGSTCGILAVSSRGSESGKIYRVACNFTAVEDDSSQLSLAAGDLIRVHCRDPSGWTFGRLECPCGGEASDRTRCTGKMGWFPEAVLLIDELGKHATKDALVGAQSDKPCHLEDDAKDNLPIVDPSSTSALAECERISDEIPTEMASRSNPEPIESEDIEIDTDPFIWTDSGDTGSTSKRPVTARASAEVLRENTDPLNRLSRVEEEKVRLCERHLAEVALTRKRYLGACETAGRGATEAAEEVETAEKRIAFLEEQSRKCRAEVACVASSTSYSMKQSADAKLRTLEARKENASINLVAAQERLGQERHTFGRARDRSHAESQAAAVAVEALSRQRSQASTAIRNLVQTSGILHPSNSLASSSTAPPVEDTRCKASQARANIAKAIRGGGRDARGDGDDATRSRSQSLQQRKAGASRSTNCRTPSANRFSGATSSRGASGPNSGAPPPRSNATASRSTLRHRSQSGSASPPRMSDDRGQARYGLARAQSRDHFMGTGHRRPSASPARRIENESRVNRPAKSKDFNARSESRKRGSEVPKKATEAELNHMLDVLQTAEALQAKLAAMPEHLRVPLAKHCANLHGFIHAEQAKTKCEADSGTMQADLVAALSTPAQH